MTTRYEDYSGPYNKRFPVRDGKEICRNGGYNGFLDEIVYMAGYAPEAAAQEIRSRFRTISLLEAIAIGSAAETPSRKQRLEEMAGVIGRIANTEDMHTQWLHRFEGHRDLMVRAAEGNLRIGAKAVHMSGALHEMRKPSMRGQGYDAVCATAASGIRDHYTRGNADQFGRELIAMEHELDQACDGPNQLFRGELDVEERFEGIGDVMFAVRLVVDDRP